MAYQNNEDTPGLSTSITPEMLSLGYDYFKTAIQSKILKIILLIIFTFLLLSEEIKVNLKYAQLSVYVKQPANASNLSTYFLLNYTIAHVDRDSDVITEELKDVQQSENAKQSATKSNISLYFLLNHTSVNVDLSIPEKMILPTLHPGDFPNASLGGATIDMFMGKWIPDETFSHLSPPICPVVASINAKYSCCNYTTGFTTPNHVIVRSFQRRFRKYVAPGLEPFNATFFVSQVKKHGPVLFVGDSLTGQMFWALRCIIEHQLGWDVAGDDNIATTSSADLIMPRDEMITEMFEFIPSSRDHTPENIDEFEEFFDMKWVDRAIEMNASYVVYNTGAWWNYFKNFRMRGNWCKYDKWAHLSQEQMVLVYERAFQTTLLPALKMLRNDHGIITVWRDIAPGGEWDAYRNDIRRWKNDGNYYNLFPIYNRIARKLITEEAGGIILPIFDLSQARYHEHVFTDATYTDYDPLHWCESFSPYYVPAVWAQLLAQVLFGNDSRGIGDDRIDNSTRRSLETPVTPSKPHLRANSTSHGIRKSPKRLRLLKRRKPKINPWRPVPFSESNLSLCHCNEGKTYYHCVANIGCQWLKSTNGTYLCTEK